MDDDRARELQQRLTAIRIYAEGLAADFPELKVAADNIIKLATGQK